MTRRNLYAYTRLILAYKIIDIVRKIADETSPRLGGRIVREE